MKLLIFARDVLHNAGDSHHVTMKIYESADSSSDFFNGNQWVCSHRQESDCSEKEHVIVFGPLIGFVDINTV